MLAVRGAGSERVTSVLAASLTALRSSSGSRSAYQQGPAGAGRDAGLAGMAQRDCREPERSASYPEIYQAWGVHM